MLKNLLGFFSKSTKENLSPNILKQISFSYMETETMNIEFALPAILEKEDEYDNEDLVKQSELYAQMLILINTGYYDQAIINGLKNIIKNDSNNNNRLLASNILSFYLVLQKANVSYSQKSAISPKIRPTEVFKMPIG
jgi:hypothetical protein